MSGALHVAALRQGMGCVSRIVLQPKFHGASYINPSKTACLLAYLDENQEWPGEWYLPGKGEKTPGVLRYTDGQIGVELLYPLVGVGDRAAEAVYGRTSEGIVTITDVRFAKYRKRGLAYSAVFGWHAGAEKKVFKVGVTFDILKEWAVPSRQHTDALQIYDPDNESEFGKGAQEIFESQLDEDVKCTLSISLGASHHAIEGARQYHTSGFVIESKRGMPLKDMMSRYVNGIKHFLMAVMGRPLNLSEIHVLSGADRPMRVYLPVDRRSDTGSDLDHLFNVEPAAGAFGSILRKWFALYKGNMYYLERLFQTFDTPYTDPLHFPAYSVVLEMCHFAATSRPSSKVSQAEIIKWALGRFECDFKNLSDFEEKVRKFRNSLVHYKHGRGKNNDELYMVTHDLFYLIRVILVEQCGVDVRHDIAQFLFLQKAPDSKRFSAGPNDAEAVRT